MFLRGLPETAEGVQSALDVGVSFHRHSDIHAL
jgi:hypothetical protein